MHATYIYVCSGVEVGHELRGVVGLREQVLHVDLLLLLSAEGHSEAAQHAGLFKRLQLVPDST